MSKIAIPFNKPFLTGKEAEYIQTAMQSGHLSGDGAFTKKCNAWLQEKVGCAKALLTHSCTAALEMAAILADVQPGDEVIVPSYTFVSTANAFVLRGANIVFVDIRKDTMNIDETLIEKAITSKTKAIIPVHYAGVACEMDTIMEIAGKYNLIVVEDAAQGLMSSYKGRALGTIGHMGTLSFHETKNIIAGEGGALLINAKQFVERAEIIREKGTDRSRFIRGQVDKYTWVDIGSSFLPSELNAAFLYAQLENAQQLTDCRMEAWNIYYEELSGLADNGKIELPVIPAGCVHNAHMFYIKTANIEERTALIQHLKSHQISALFHYIPLHSAAAGQRHGVFRGEDRYTTCESERLLRLPMFCGLGRDQLCLVTDSIKEFYGNGR